MCLQRATHLDCFFRSNLILHGKVDESIILAYLTSLPNVCLYSASFVKAGVNGMPAIGSTERLKMR